jgi:hypothetical protein
MYRGFDHERDYAAYLMKSTYRNTAYKNLTVANL